MCKRDVSPGKHKCKSQTGIAFVFYDSARLQRLLYYIEQESSCYITFLLTRTEASEAIAAKLYLHNVHGRIGATVDSV